VWFQTERNFLLLPHIFYYCCKCRKTLVKKCNLCGCFFRTAWLRVPSFFHSITCNILLKRFH